MRLVPVLAVLVAMLAATADVASADFVLKHRFQLNAGVTSSGGTSLDGVVEDCDGRAVPPCTQVTSTVALVRGGATVAESAPGVHPLMNLGEPPQAGDVIALRRDGAEVASAAWTGLPTIDGNPEDSSATITGSKDPGLKLSASTASGEQGVVADNGSTYSATFSAAPACNSTYSVSATRQTTDEASGTVTIVNLSRGAQACPGGPYSRRATLGTEGADLVLRPTGAGPIGASFAMGATVDALPVGTGKGTVTPLPGCSRPAGWGTPMAGFDATCPVPAGSFRAVLGDEVDDLGFAGSGRPVAATLGGGDDKLGIPSGSSVDLTADGGAGRDTFSLSPSGAGVLVVDGGSGDDSFDISGQKHSGGAITIRGGAGNDRIGLSTTTRGAKIDGGAGNDSIVAADAERQTIICGPGADDVFPDGIDRLGAGCAPHLSQIPTGRIARSSAGRPAQLTVRLGRLSATASLTVTVSSDDSRRLVLGRATRRAAGGRAVVVVPLTATGRSVLRAHPRQRVFVRVLVRSHGDVEHDAVVGRASS